PPSLLPLSFFSSMLLRPPCSTLFPYTTLFRSFAAGRARISFNLQKATVKQENVSTIWGAKTLVAFGLRYVEANSNFDMARYGRRSEEHTSELQSRENLVCRLLLEKKKQQINTK